MNSLLIPWLCKKKNDCEIRLKMLLSLFHAHFEYDKHIKMTSLWLHLILKVENDSTLEAFTLDFTKINKPK